MKFLCDLYQLYFCYLVNDMLHHLTELLIERNEARRGIQIAANAVSKIRAFDSQLTNAHTSLCHVSIHYFDDNTLKD